MKSISITTAVLNKTTTWRTIFDCLCAQQGAYMKAHKKSEVLVRPARLRKYAKACANGLKANIKLCETQRQHTHLHNAVMRKLAAGGREFLKAL